MLRCQPVLLDTPAHELLPDASPDSAAHQGGRPALWSPTLPCWLRQRERFMLSPIIGVYSLPSSSREQAVMLREQIINKKKQSSIGPSRPPNNTLLGFKVWEYVVSNKNSLHWSYYPSLSYKCFPIANTTALKHYTVNWICKAVLPLGLANDPTFPSAVFGQRSKLIVLSFRKVWVVLFLPSFEIFLVATSMKIASVSYAFILGNICILEIRAHYANHSLHAIMKLKKFRS